MQKPRTDIYWFLSAGVMLVACFTVLGLNSWRFGYDFAVADMPVLAMVGILLVAGLCYCVAAFAVWHLAGNPLQAPERRQLFIVALIVGGLARLILSGSEPILEDDYQRYLWDGAVTAAGQNPYAVVPAEALKSENAELAAVAQAAGLTLKRVNHPEIRTIYPPGAQAFFALAHTIEPFSLAAWRGVVMAADLATFLLVLLLLRAAALPSIWSVLYWWNPLIIKELTNAVHMEAVLMPFVVAAVWFAVRKRPLLAATAIGIAGAIKIWPLALFPVLVRTATNRRGLMVASLVLVGVISVAWAVPMVLAGLDRSAGVVAYAEKWRTNSAMFEILLRLAHLSGLASLGEGITSNHIARGFIALIVVTAGLAFARNKPGTPHAAIRQAGLVAVAMFLVSPAQFPWYVAWIAPFLPFLPLPGLIVLAATMPLYYVAFHLMAIDAFALFNSVVIWCVWCPAWALLMLQIWWPEGARLFAPSSTPAKEM